MGINVGQAFSGLWNTVNPFTQPAPLAGSGSPLGQDTFTWTPVAPVIETPAERQFIDQVVGTVDQSVDKTVGTVVDRLAAPLVDGQVGPRGARAFMHPERQPDGKNPGQIGLPFQPLSFTSDDGKTPLTGWYIPASPPSDKTIVIAHGFGGQQSQFMVQDAPWLHAAGYNVLTFDFRNSGGSGGDHTSMGYEERDDLKAAIDQAVALGGKHVAVVGTSMGGATAIEEAANDPRVQAVVDDCAFDTVRNAIEPRMKKTLAGQDLPLPGILGKVIHTPFYHSEAGWQAGAQALTDSIAKDLHEPIGTDDPLHAIPKLGDRPVFIIHGGADDQTLPVDSRNLFAADPAQAVGNDPAALAAPGAKKSLWIVPGANHARSYDKDPQGYQARVLAFLDGAFETPNP